jgi:hypothetical protein
MGRVNNPLTTLAVTIAVEAVGAGRVPLAAIRKRQYRGERFHNSSRAVPDCRQKRFVLARRMKHRGNTMQTKRTYQVQHWPNGQWNREHNWRKVEASSEKEAAEKVCGLALTERGTLAQLRARVLTFGDFKQRSATPFYAAE